MNEAINRFLPEKHHAFEAATREVFIGQTIRGVIYGEVSFENEKGDDQLPEPFYKTYYPDIDSLDHSIYFKTDDKTIYVNWDWTFYCFGLAAQLVDFTETTNDYEQKWDVTDQPKWQEVIGDVITDFEIVWEIIWGTEGPSKPMSEIVKDKSWVYGHCQWTCVFCPMSFIIHTKRNKKILFGAAKFLDSDKFRPFPFCDNLLVTLHIDLAKLIGLLDD
jgi:hypothetical protein